jgi:hypothetical protein
MAEITLVAAVWTELTQTVESLQIERRSAERASRGREVAMKVRDG